jgi:hypothetical protein
MVNIYGTCVFCWHGFPLEFSPAKAGPGMMWWMAPFHGIIDAEAIREAASRPSMRFVPVKTMENQAIAMPHRSRDLLIKNRTMLVNALRGHLAGFGLLAARYLSAIAAQ